MISNSRSEALEANGWKWTLAAGMAPLIAGVLLLGATWWSFFHQNDGWSLGISRLDFSGQAIRAVSPSAASYLETLGSVGAVNIVAGAVAVIVVSRNSLQQRQRWAWWFLLFCFVWVGLHDAWSATRFFLVTHQPLLVLPYTYCALLTIGLFKSKSVAFGG